MSVWQYIVEWLREHGDVIVEFCVGFTISVFVLCCLFSCKTKTVVVTEYKDRQVHDTTLLVDSIWRDRWHTEYWKGDTIFIRDSVFVDRFKYRDIVVERVERDSIPYEVEVVQYVRQRNGYDRFTSWAFWILVVLAIIRVGWWAFKKYYLKR